MRQGRRMGNGKRNEIVSPGSPCRPRPRAGSSRGLPNPPWPLHNGRMADGENDAPSTDGKGDNGGNRSNSGYMNGIVIGMMFSVVFGLLVFDNLALGFGVGLPIGIAIGMAMDSKRKADGGPAKES